ncbi:acyl-CoA dehydrogenase (plasmid) [Sphingomonas panacis]|uniref:Acyl-CoA dehydrogenase n=1 Tax=Sphingomonas panacis TaxID=1560345 RepID=A0A1B3ZIE4_9SPHN|nr:acyl-CoA dehydrogenase [Sphingomonas panacis]AOH87198.1 acyl-CoA dehydrogenase [Sphingomonas panacis]
MSDALIVRRDVSFLLFDWLDLGKHHDRATIDSVLDLSEKLAEQAFLPHYKGADVHEPQLKDGQVSIYPPIGGALREYANLGLFAAGFPEDIGGLALPSAACWASYAYFAAANIAIAGYAMLTVANARLIATFGSPNQIEQFAQPEIEGRWFGTMCLSEPQAGSSLADVRTRAEPDGSDDLGARYRLTGNKMWISGGDQDASENIVHLVLAKVPGADGSLPAGTEGLSLFIVPKTLPDGSRNDISVAGLNHKMGFRGTANCLLNFGEKDGAIGWLVGEPGRGLRQMFQMMNEARIGVGVGAAALAYRSYRLSVAYAGERLQGREIGTRTGDPIAIIRHPDVKRMLLSQKVYAEGALALCLLCASLVDNEADAEARELLALLTPVAKTWSSEYGLAANDLAIQIHGGYGYTRDFDVEQLWRDNRLNPIHEGTTGIQAIDLLGRKVLNDDGAGLASLEARIARTVGRTVGTDREVYAQQLVRLSGQIATCIEALRQHHAPLANATTFLSAFGHVVVALLWLEQANAASALEGEDAFAAGKRRACRFFYEYEVPRVDAWLAIVRSGTDVAGNAPLETFI